MSGHVSEEKGPPEGLGPPWSAAEESQRGREDGH